MVPLPLFKSVRRILALGVHSDDIEIGAGDPLLTLIKSNSELEVYWAVFSASGVRKNEARDGAYEYLLPFEKPRIDIASFRERYFPDQWTDIELYLEAKTEFELDIVFIHYRDDRHQDHRVLSDLAWNTFRNHLILECP
jgi:LmbE family N-acetylglucosaminyl deacetylase